MCIGLVGCDGNTDDPVDTNESMTQEETEGETSMGFEDNKDYDKKVMLACGFDKTTYDLAELIGGRDHVVTKKGQTLDSATVKLDIGANEFSITYKVSGIERTALVNIARRAGYRVVFNTNGGSFIETQYVEDCAIIDPKTVVPTRDRYTFEGWYNEAGKKVDLSTTQITSDTTFIAHWSGPNSFALPDTVPVKYTTSSAALNINWKDYADAFGFRPSEVRCTLTNVANGKAYNVKVTKDSATFVGTAPEGVTISQGAGNWTVKITGFPGDSRYTFSMNDLGNPNYTTIQSGTSVYNTIVGYEPLRDDSSNLMTMNGRFYDVAGNVVVLKGAVPRNVNSGTCVQNTSTDCLARMKAEGINCIRITMPLGSSAGYLTPGKKDGYVSTTKGVVNRATELGMYVIVDWGVMMKKVKVKDPVTGVETEINYADPSAGYLDQMLEPAKEFFGTMSSSYADNPYIIYELANEPTVSAGNAWETYLRPWYEKLINTIRKNDPNGVILAAPNMHARRISDDYDNQQKNNGKGDDPIDKPFATELSFNIGYTFHCYSYTTTYDCKYGLYKNEEEKAIRTASEYGWRVCDAVKNGLTIVITEFSPADASMSSADGVDAVGHNADFLEMDKWINFILENDMNYMMFRFNGPTGAANAVNSQTMFIPGCESAIYKGTWTPEMLGDSGRYFYDNLLNTTGFIEKALFTVTKTAEAAQ